MTPARNSARGGFSLLEVMTVLVIILILAVMLLQASTGWRAKADQARCIENLKSLYVGATNYILEQGHWPQISTDLIADGGAPYAQAWREALAPYGISRQTWLCPTIQQSLGQPDVEMPSKARTDYLATPFDDKANTPYRWSTQPWFIEKGASHPGGNLMIFEDAQVMTIQQAVRRIPPPQ